MLATDRLCIYSPAFMCSLVGVLRPPAGHDVIEAHSDPQKEPTFSCRSYCLQIIGRKLEPQSGRIAGLGSSGMRDQVRNGGIHVACRALDLQCGLQVGHRLCAPWSTG
jgi:hypothetical protein